MILSFPGGAGGNWLKCVFAGNDISGSKVNFHKLHKHIGKSKIHLIHSLNPDEFDYLFSGDYYFNFFVNVIYKHFHYEANFTEVNSYKDYYTTCINTAKFLCKFEDIKHCIFFNFNDLIYNDIKFYQNLISIKPDLNLSYENFVHKKNIFFNTMVRTQESYENFDEEIWVTFVLGQLMNHNIFPNNFSIYDPANQSLAAEFAKNHYHHCKLNQVHHFESNIFLPKLLQVN